MDADWSHSPAYLPSLMAALDDGADLVIGSRYTAGGGVRDWGLMRRIVSRGGSIFARTVLRLTPARPDGRLQGLAGEHARARSTGPASMPAATCSRSR